MRPMRSARTATVLREMCTVFHVISILLLLLIGLLTATAASTSSPRTHHKHGHHHSHQQEWDRTEIMDANGLFILEWNIVDAKEIVFKITVNTGGFIGLGFSHKTGKMANADLVLAWVDDHTGKPNVLVIILRAILEPALCVLYLCEKWERKGIVDIQKKMNSWLSLLLGWARTGYRIYRTESIHHSHSFRDRSNGRNIFSWAFRGCGCI